MCRFLVPLQQKMLKIVATENARERRYADVEEAVGKIDSRELDAVQAFRRALRKNSKQLRTEGAYVGKLATTENDIERVRW